MALTLDLAGVLIEDFFLHSHDSCAITFEECLVPLSIGSFDFAKGEGLKNTLFLHGSIDHATPAQGLARKLGTDAAARHMRLVEGADHFRILMHTDEIVAACERLRSRMATSTEEAKADLDRHQQPSPECQQSLRQQQEQEQQQQQQQQQQLEKPQAQEQKQQLSSLAPVPQPPVRSSVDDLE